ncbi:hypothetical protein JCM3765_001274 [Sporobolomyces pararoseus]
MNNTNPIGYSHYQPPPQPIQFPYPTPTPQRPSQYTQIPSSYPVQLEQLQQRANELPPMTNFAPSNIGNPFAQLSPTFQPPYKSNPSKNVGIGQDFQLFGPSDPLGGLGAGLSNVNDEDDERVRRQLGSIDSSGAVPDLISDRGSPSIDSPPSPAFAPSKLPMRPPPRPALPSSTSTNGSGSYRGEGRASSVPPPEFPKPMRRKTQENLHWPSFVHSGSSSSSSSSSASTSSNYLPTPQQYPQTSLPFVDEPSNYSLPPASQSSNPFDPSSFTLSPAAQFPYSYQAPHTDHPLLPSEQSDLLDRVRRDLLDVDLSSIKGPLRALALSGSEGSPGQFSMMSPLPNYARYQPGGGGNRNGSVDRDKTPTPRMTTSNRSPRSPAISALAHSEAGRDSSIGTVSPQDAFLDYPAVDSKLHDLDPKDGQLARSDFGVGVGHSLFAPLPTTTSSPLQKSSSSASSSKNKKSHPPLSISKVQSLPTSRSATPRASQQHQQQSTQSSTNFGRQHVPHPFSVPQNAVSWATRRSNSGRHLVGGVVDGDADDDDGDFGGEEGLNSSSTEVTAGEDEDDSIEYKMKLEGIREKAGLPRGFGQFDRKDLSLGGRNTTEVERARHGVEKEGELNGSRPIKEEYGDHEYKVPVNQYDDQDEDENDLKDEKEEEAEENKFSFVPPPSHSSVLQFASPRRTVNTASGTSTPRRAAAANALAGLQAQSPGEEAEGNFVDDSSAAGTSDLPPIRSQRQRKRSRLAMEEDENFTDPDGEGSSDEYREPGGGLGGGGDDEDDETLGFAPPPKRSARATAGDDSDESYHSSSAATTPAASSSSNRRNNSNKDFNAPPPKRRRRAPATTGKGGGSTTKSNAKGSIACDFVSDAGEHCGVVFRRPYDLARHKETIHGVTMKGEKLPPGKTKEWKCKECGGTFSRKDALLRHGRIRGHKPGV